MELSELSSRGFQHTCPLLQGFRNFFLTGQDSPKTIEFLTFDIYLPQDPEKVRFYVDFDIDLHFEGNRNETCRNGQLRY